MVKELRIFHISDLHIGVKNQLLGVDGHFQKVLEELGKLAELAVIERVKFIVITGDIFNSNAIADSYVEKFFEVLKNSKEIKFILIPGGGDKNLEGMSGHDAYVERSIYRRIGVISLLNSADNIFLLTPERRVVNIGGVVFAAGFFDLAPEVDEGSYRIAVMHGAYGNRKEFGEIALTEKFLSNFNYIALGHYHTYSLLAANAAYSGAFIQFEFVGGKRAVGGYLDVKITEKGCSIKFVENSSPKFYVSRIMTEDSLNLLEESLKEGAMVKVTSYMEEFEQNLISLKESYRSRLLINSSGRIQKNNSPFVEVLTEVIDKVPEEYKSEVEEIIMYGLFASPTSKEFEVFLKEKFGLEE